MVRVDFLSQQEKIPVGLCHIKQVHGTDVYVVNSDNIKELAVESPVICADALVTSLRGVPLGIKTADCLPVFIGAFESRTNKALAIAVVHAGWKGLVAGVLENSFQAIQAMAKKQDQNPSAGSRDIYYRGSIGPCLGTCCFEVGPEVVELFRSRLSSQAKTGELPEICESNWLRKKDTFSKAHIDLRYIAERILLSQSAQLKMEPIKATCTKCDPTWASYRRDGAGAKRNWLVANI